MKIKFSLNIYQKKRLETISMILSLLIFVLAILFKIKELFLIGPMILLISLFLGYILFDEKLPKKREKEVRVPFRKKDGKIHLFSKWKVEETPKWDFYRDEAYLSKKYSLI